MSGELETFRYDKDWIRLLGHMYKFNPSLMMVWDLVMDSVRHVQRHAYHTEEEFYGIWIVKSGSSDTWFTLESKWSTLVERIFRAYNNLPAPKEKFLITTPVDIHIKCEYNELEKEKEAFKQYMEEKAKEHCSNRSK